MTNGCAVIVVFFVFCFNLVTLVLSNIEASNTIGAFYVCRILSFQFLFMF